MARRLVSESVVWINLCIGFLTPPLGMNFVRGPSHIKAITGEYCKTEYAIPVGADCGHVYHHALPRHHLVPAELFEMI
jgi:hypothetical protein